MTHNKKLFLSAVSSEFSAYRELLASDLKRPNLDIKVQEEIEKHGYEHRKPEIQGGESYV
jgi:hypothetical protein